MVLSQNSAWGPHSPISAQFELELLVFLSLDLNPKMLLWASEVLLADLSFSPAKSMQLRVALPRQAPVSRR